MLAEDVAEAMDGKPLFTMYCQGSTALSYTSFILCISALFNSFLPIPPDAGGGCSGGHGRQAPVHASQRGEGGSQVQACAHCQASRHPRRARVSVLSGQRAQGKQATNWFFVISYLERYDIDVATVFKLTIYCPWLYDCAQAKLHGTRIVPVFLFSLANGPKVSE